MVSGVDFPLNQSIESWKAFFWGYDMKLFMVKFHHVGFIGSTECPDSFSDITISPTFPMGKSFMGQKRSKLRHFWYLVPSGKLT